LTGALAEQQYLARRRRVTRREHRLIVRELRGLIADAVERAAVRTQDGLDARVRPLRNLLHLFERGRTERLERERAAPSAHVDAIEGQRVRVDVEAQCGVRALYEGHCADVCVVYARQAELRLRATP